MTIEPKHQRIFISLFLLLVAAACLEDAQAQIAMLPKIEFEQKTHILVWDIGTEPGYLDSGDDFTDINHDCSVLERRATSDPAQALAASKGISVKALNDTVAQIFARYHLNASDYKMNPVAASLGRDDQPVFFLFPELHIRELSKQTLGALHESKARDLLKMTTLLDGQGVHIVNTIEGPQSTWSPEFKLTPMTLDRRIEDAYKLMAKIWILAGVLIGEVYADKIPTQYSDSNDLAIRYLLSVAAYELSQESSPLNLDVEWNRAVLDLRRTYPQRFDTVKMEDYKPFFENLVARPSDEIRAISSKMCEARSAEMARYTFEMAKSRGASVAYMGFGVLYTHGVIEQLRKYSASYIVFSPNL